MATRLRMTGAGGGAAEPEPVVAEVDLHDSDIPRRSSAANNGSNHTGCS